MSEPVNLPELFELAKKWREISDRYFNIYSNSPAPTDRRDFGLSDAYVTCADELTAALPAIEEMVRKMRELERDLVHKFRTCYQSTDSDKRELCEKCRLRAILEKVGVKL